MTFSALQKQRGSALIVALVMAMIILVAGTGLLRRSSTDNRIAKRRVNETRLMTTAHGFAALLKQDLENNYNLYLSDAAWAPCRKAGNINVDSFTHILETPADTTYVSNAVNCPTVNVAFTYFTTAETSTTNLVALSALKTKMLRAKPEFEVNGFNLEFKLEDFTLTGTRSRVASSMLLGTASQADLALNRSVRMVVDLKRTLDPPTPGNSCGICRTVAGAVCCGGAVSLAYLEAGSGRIMEATFDRGSQSVINQQPLASEVGNENPLAVTVRNLTTTRKDYGALDFCIPSIQAEAVRYVIDTLQDDSGNNYHLTIHGNILKNGTQIATDPKLKSFALDGASWYLLRTDGAVLEASDITNPTTYTPLDGFTLPTAKKIVMGKGPTTSCVP